MRHAPSPSLVTGPRPQPLPHAGADRALEIHLTQSLLDLDPDLQTLLLVGERAPGVRGELEYRPGTVLGVADRYRVADLAHLDALAAVTAEAGLAPVPA